MLTFDDGDLVRVSGTFTDSDGTETDPDAVMVQYRFNNGAVTEKVYGTDAEVEKVSTGVYRMSIDTTGQSGKICYYRIYSTGNGQSAEEGKFLVSGSRIV